MTNATEARLRDMRAELLGDITRDHETLSVPLDDKGEDTTPSQHPADVASDLLAREDLLTIDEHFRLMLRSVDEALARIRAGTYGVCVECGGPIAPERLAVKPEASLCIACARRAETRL